LSVHCRTACMAASARSCDGEEMTPQVAHVTIDANGSAQNDRALHMLWFGGIRISSICFTKQVSLHHSGRDRDLASRRDGSNAADSAHLVRYQPICRIRSRMSALY
jgi:hypothetical protein